MQKLGMYAMFDKKSETYDTPFFAYNDVMAKRKFIMAIQTPDTISHNFNEDFTLKKLGIFDVINGNFEPDNIELLDGKSVVVEPIREEFDRQAFEEKIIKDRRN